MAFYLTGETLKVEYVALRGAVWLHYTATEKAGVFCINVSQLLYNAAVFLFQTRNPVIHSFHPSSTLTTAFTVGVLFKSNHSFARQVQYVAQTAARVQPFLKKQNNNKKKHPAAEMWCQASLYKPILNDDGFTFRLPSDSSSL